MKRVLPFGLLILVAFLPGRGLAQAVGSITGTVFDESEAVVKGAQVTVIDQGTNEQRRVSANGTGNFACTLLPIGTYSVHVSQAGFQSYVSKNITLEGQQTVSLEIKLALSAVSQTVSVSGETGSDMVQRSDATLGQTIHAEQITNLPLNGRDFVQLALLTVPAISSYWSCISPCQFCGPYPLVLRTCFDALKIAAEILRSSTLLRTPGSSQGSPVRHLVIRRHGFPRNRTCMA